MPHANVDDAWNTLAKSIIGGPLSRLDGVKCHSIKTSTLDNERNDCATHALIALNFEDCFNERHVELVSRTSPPR